MSPQTIHSCYESRFVVGSSLQRTHIARLPLLPFLVFHDKMPHACRNCREEGHNIVTCPTAVRTDGKVRKETQCSRCDKVGHNVRTCPLPQFAPFIVGMPEEEEEKPVEEEKPLWVSPPAETLPMPCWDEPSAPAPPPAPPSPAPPSPAPPAPTMREDEMEMLRQIISGRTAFYTSEFHLLKTQYLQDPSAFTYKVRKETDRRDKLSVRIGGRTFAYRVEAGWKGGVRRVLRISSIGGDREPVSVAEFC